MGAGQRMVQYLPWKTARLRPGQNSLAMLPTPIFQTRKNFAVLHRGRLEGRSGFLGQDLSIADGLRTRFFETINPAASTLRPRSRTRAAVRSCRKTWQPIPAEQSPIGMHNKALRRGVPLLKPDQTGCSRPKTLFPTGKVLPVTVALLFCGASLFAQTSLPDAPQPHFSDQADQQWQGIGISWSQTEQEGQAKSESTGLPQSSATIPESNGVQTATPSPLTSKQKFLYGASASVSPLAFIEDAVKAGFYQETGFRRRYGTGTTGYFKQFGASTADSALRNMTGDYLYGSLFHEDPRYYPMGPGPFGKRLGYALSRAFITRSDSGQKVFNWASVLGSTTSAGLSNFYLPQQDRTVNTALGNVVWFLMGTAVNDALQEFLPGAYNRLDRHF